MELSLLGITPNGALILGGFFTAHDTHGYHCDWFLPMFLEGGFELSVPYFAAEILQHPTRDMDIMWPLLRAGFQEARREFDERGLKARLHYYLSSRWTRTGKPSLQELALGIMQEQRENGKAYQAWQSAVNAKLKQALDTRV